MEIVIRNRSAAIGPLLALGGVFVLATGAVHLREWFETYRDVPASAPGSWVVRYGFPFQAVTAALAAAALVVGTLRRRSWTLPVAGAAVAFELSSIAVLVLTRQGKVFGWTEPIWNAAARQTLALEVAAVVVLVSLVAADRLHGRVGGWSAPTPARSGPA